MYTKGQIVSLKDTGERGRVLGGDDKGNTIVDFKEFGNSAHDRVAVSTNELKLASAFTCNPDKFKYKRTRRGVDATCPIQKGSATVATLYDDASAIVAKVEFEGTAMQAAKLRAEFLAEARAAGFNQPSEAFAISEYARKMTMDAEG